MNTFWVPIWKKAPFIRLLLPLIAGILIEWYEKNDLPQIIIALAGFSIAITVFRFLPLVVRFKLSWLQGILINLLLLAFGSFITYQKDIRHEKNWFPNFYHDSDYIIATINTPLQHKNKTSKT